jgi:hypothetical protein
MVGSKRQACLGAGEGLEEGERLVEAAAEEGVALARLLEVRAQAASLRAQLAGEHVRGRALP